MTSAEIQSKIREYDPAADVELIDNAYEFSEAVHRGQTRMSGEAYFTHPIAVADILADMKMDVPTIVTGLLHDTVEDTLTTPEEISARFGTEIGALVDGVTKISKLEADSREAVEAESLRKMFLASARDIRVLLVKLADRYHNIKTLGHLPEDRRKRIAQETLDVYAPLAHRLGVYWLKLEYEEAAFRTLWPDEYKEVRQQLALHKLERDGYIAEITTLLGKRLREAGLDPEVSGRPKSAFSIHNKMKDQGLRSDDVYDVVAFRIQVDRERDCYDALGIVHTNWRPVPGRFRDYIALPKANMYQSLHTTVIGPYGERMEIQIRTREMHRACEYGIAAHWRYKTSEDREGGDAERFAWLEQLLDWQHNVEDPREFLSTVKQHLFAEEVHVFTPKGEAETFPQGATVIDFAYRIHSDIGDHCTGARVNGQLVPVRYQLQAGDTIEVITTDEQSPSREWLKFVTTPRARQRIMVWLKHDERAKAMTVGRKIIERDLARYQLDMARLRRDGRMATMLRHFRKETEDDLLEAIGYGRITPSQVIVHLLPDQAAREAKVPRRLKRLFGLISRQRKPAVTVQGAEETVIRFGKCCQPLPGEAIVGFLTRGRGVTVHSRDCQRIEGVDRERVVEASWEKGATAARPVKIEVRSRDRPGVLAGMSQAIASAGVNIDKAYVRTTADGGAFNVFEVTLESADELVHVTRNLRRVPGVREVRRVRT